MLRRNKPSRTIALLTLIAMCGSPAVQAQADTNANWPAFRGANASGVADGPCPPDQWDVADGKNVLWKMPIPGLGHASPIIWGDHLYVVNAISGKQDAKLKVGLYGDIAPVEDDSVHKWVLYCLDKNSGKPLWETQLHEGVPKIKRHTKATHANSTPATDGKNIVVMLGSEGLYCVSSEGKLRWSKDLGTLDSGYYVVPGAQWGFAASPVIHDDRIIIQADVQANSFIAAYALDDGKELWRTPRDEVPTWGSPAIYETKERTQAIVNGYDHIGGYDIKDGKEIWRMSGRDNGGGDIPVPTPVLGHGNAYIANAHGQGGPIYAVRLSAEGEVAPGPDSGESKGIAWREKLNFAYMQTPLVLGDYVYSCTDRGVLSCYDAKTGERKYRARVGSGGGGFTASPIACGDHIYFTGEEGDIHIIKAGPEFEEIAHNEMNEVCMATPAISNGVLFCRTQGHVVAIGQGKAAATDAAQ